MLLWASTAGGYAVQQGRIVNAAGETIQLRGVAWYGAEVGDRLVPSGLYTRNYKNVIAQMKSLGFNAVRLPLCPRTLDAPAVSGDYFWVNKKRNPGLYHDDGSGRTPFEIFKRIATELDRQGFYILADHHLINCPDSQPVRVDIGPLWYDEGYSEADWIASLEKVTRALKPLPHFIGVDLHNEPHGATWARGKPATDWDAAAARAARAVLAIAPDRLVFVQGVAGNVICGDDDYPYWFSDWGGNLARAACEPADIPADRLVYSPHVYGPTEGVQGNDAPHFFTTDARNPKPNPGQPQDLRRAMPEVWDQWFGRLAEPAYGNHAIAIGEFAARYGRFLEPAVNGDDPLTGIDKNDTEREKRRKRRAVAGNMARDKAFLDALLGYLTEKGITDSFWWAINGDGPVGSIYYGNRLPRPDGSIHPEDQWHKIRRDIVNNDPDNPGALNRYWNQAACRDGIDNDLDGKTDAEDPACQTGSGP